MLLQTTVVHWIGLTSGSTLLWHCHTYFCCVLQAVSADKGGVDIILEMLANVNLETDLQLAAPGGRVAVCMGGAGWRGGGVEVVADWHVTTPGGGWVHLQLAAPGGKVVICGGGGGPETASSSWGSSQGEGGVMYMEGSRCGRE